MTTPTRPLSPDYGTPKSDGSVVEEPTTNARQGDTGHNVRYVLAIGTGLVIVAFAIIYFAFIGTV